MAYFHNEFVLRRKWLTEPAYADIIGLCQFLPGPASSQVGFTIGLLEAGTLGGLAAWSGFTLPSALLMFLFAYGHALFRGKIGAGILHGLGLVAVAVVAQAAFGMMRTLAPDLRRAGIVALAATIVLLSARPQAQLLAIATGAGSGLLLCREPCTPPQRHLEVVIPRTASFVSLIVFVLLLIIPALALAGLLTPANKAAVLLLERS